MALKLGKCRLCLKLGDFFSIFEVDNSIQLAEMVMECSRVKIYEGDGLPDKICSECIQKLSSSYIFKQQCERSDQELRRNYVPPPGFSITPPPTNRQSSDSAFSSLTEHSSLATAKQSTSTEGRTTPGNSNVKRSRESSEASALNDTPYPKRRCTVKMSNSASKSKKSYSHDSDYEDTTVADYFENTDTDDNSQDAKFLCDLCDKTFITKPGLLSHKGWHSRQASASKRLTENVLVEIPKEEKPEDEKLSCDKCQKTFKLSIMLKRHKETCVGHQEALAKKELLVTLEPVNAEKKYQCEMCPTRFKTIDNVEKHMRVCHAAVMKNKTPLKGETSNASIKKNTSLKEEPPSPVKTVGKTSVPCLFCKIPLKDYQSHNDHFNECPKQVEMAIYQCPICNKNIAKKSAYFFHVKNTHLEPRTSSGDNAFDCRMCNKKLPSQEQLIKHLAAHVSNIDEDDNMSRDASTIDDSESVLSDASKNSGTPKALKCNICDKQFSYKKSLLSHELKHKLDKKKSSPKTEIKEEVTSSFNNTADDEDFVSDDSSQDATDNTCDICEKQFSYRRLLLAHKKKKHNMGSGVKLASVKLKDCKLKCLICDEEMSMMQKQVHNQKHIAKNIKPRNLYMCAGCSDTFKSCQTLMSHIKLVHRLGLPQDSAMPDLADFCEVVVTKAEPLDAIQNHNDLKDVPPAVEDGAGYDCPICGKSMPTQMSLKRHVNWHTNVGNNITTKIKCFVCEEEFRFKGHYRQHMSVHYKDPNLDPKFLTCTICNRKSKHLRAAKAHMNFHKQTRFQNRDYQCSICKRIFQDRRVYLSHMSIHQKKGETVKAIVGDTKTMNKTIGGNCCPHCGKDCGSEESLKCHIRWHNSKTSLYGARHECPFQDCQLQFTNKKQQELHTRTHYEDENGPFKCPQCGKGYTDESYFQRHIKGHNFDHQVHKNRIAKLRENMTKCPICERYFKDLPKLIRHLRRTHPQSKMIKEDPDAPIRRVYSCKLCAKSFFEEKSLRIHEERHLRKRTLFKCKFCGKNSMSLKAHRLHIKSHLTRKFNDEPLKCTQCEKTFIKGYDLHHHLKDEHQIEETWIADRTKQTTGQPLKELQCAVCMKILASRGGYERHLDYHNSLRCNYCFDYFSSIQFLEGHLAFSCEKKNLIGNTEPHLRKVKCDICYKAFHLQVKLDCHLRTQHDIKVNKEERKGDIETVCDFCFRVFENEDALASHKIYHRTIGYFGCIYCNRKFNTITLYNRHKNAHFAQLFVDDPVKCEHCDETFVPFRDMIYHMRDVHGDNKDWIVMPKETIEEECHICKKVFHNVSRHLAYHEENRCKKCGEYFYSRNDFDNHLCSIDSDDEPSDNPGDIRAKYEECPFCFKGITKNTSLLQHELCHRASGAISCRFCRHRFKTLDAFNIHAFSHRSKKYQKKPLKCKTCGEKFVRYGPFVKHLKSVHKSKAKMHYRANVLPEPCVVCGDSFPNLHNHYRAHLANRCSKCLKYFTSSRVFNFHQCDKEDIDPSKVFVSDENLPFLIQNYKAQYDEKNDDEKYYGFSEEESEPVEQETEQKVSTTVSCDDDSQNSVDAEQLLPISVQSPIIADVLSLYEQKANGEDSNEQRVNDQGDDDDDVIILDDDDDSVGFEGMVQATITLDD